MILTDTIWPISPCINATISIMKKLQYNFPKMRGGESKVVWTFSKKSSDLVAGSFPKLGSSFRISSDDCGGPHHLDQDDFAKT